MDQLPPLPGLTIQDQPVPTILERNPLRDAMKAATAAGTAGIHSITPAEQAHHIVPGERPIDAGRNATEAQKILAEFGIGLDTLVNGVGLTPGLHSRIHTKDYYAYINKVFSRIINKQQAEQKLNQIAQEWKQADAAFIKNGTIPDFIPVGDKADSLRIPKRLEFCFDSLKR